MNPMCYRPTERRLCATMLVFAVLHIFTVILVLADNSAPNRQQVGTLTGRRRNPRNHHHSRHTHHHHQNQQHPQPNQRPYRQHQQQRRGQQTVRQGVPEFVPDVGSRGVPGVSVHDVPHADDSRRRHQNSQNPQTRRQNLNSRQSVDSSVVGNQLDRSYSDAREERMPENCSACIVRRVDRLWRVEKMKQDILDKLGLSAPPNVTGKKLPNIPQLEQFRRPDRSDSMLRDDPYHSPRYQYQSDAGETRSVTKRIFIVSKKAPHTLGLPGSVDDKTYFQFPPDLTHNRIQKASMYLFVKRPRVRNVRRIAWIKVYKIKRLHHGALVEILVKELKIHINVNKPGDWIQIEATKLVINWLKSPHSNYGLRIVTTIIPNLVVLNNEVDDHKPYIDITVRNKRPNRMRRTPGNECRPDSREERCCRYPLVIDFVQFGWDWIVSPKRFKANYCSGECPYLFKSTYLHSVLLSQAEPAGAKGPCCSPIRLSPISLLYFADDGAIHLSQLEDMAVDECKCS